MRKLRTKFILPGVLLALVPLAVGCSSKTVTETAVETTTAVTTAETTQITEPTTTAEPEPSILKSYALIDIDDFNNDVAWVKFKVSTGEGLKAESEAKTGLIDKQGKLLYVLPEKCEHGEFQSGVTSVYNSDEDERIIIDNTGKELYRMPKSTDTEKISFIGQAENKFFMSKHTTTYADNYYEIYVIDENGKTISDVIKSDKELTRLEYIGGDNYVLGEKYLVNIKDLSFKKAVIDSGYYGIYKVEDENGNEIAKVEDSDYSEGIKYEPSSIVETPGYYDEDGKLVVKLPELQGEARVYYARAFTGGYAVLDIIGADGKNYVTCIDKTSKMQYEPKRIDYYSKESVYGYALVEINEEDDCFITPKGEVKKIGLDDLSEMGNEVYIEEFVSEGFIRLTETISERKNLSTKVGYLNLSDNSTLTTADVYSDSAVARELGISEDERSYENSDFDIKGSWKSVGSSGFGQATPGQTVVFGDENCNFYSPKDTYKLYFENGSWKLDCKNVLWGDILTFNVKIVDNNNIKISGVSNIVTELKRI